MVFRNLQEKLENVITSKNCNKKLAGFRWDFRLEFATENSNLECNLKCIPWTLSCFWCTVRRDSMNLCWFLLAKYFLHGLFYTFLFSFIVNIEILFTNLHLHLLIPLRMPKSYARQILRGLMKYNDACLFFYFYYPFRFLMKPDMTFWNEKQLSNFGHKKIM